MGWLDGFLWRSHDALSGIFISTFLSIFGLTKQVGCDNNLYMYIQSDQGGYKKSVIKDIQYTIQSPMLVLDCFFI